jgi:hypothetical protein
MKEDLYTQPQPRTDILNPDGSPFDNLASAYDAWFEQEGKLIFTIEVEAFRKVLPLLSKPWLEVGVGSGRFAQALNIKMGIDPLCQATSNRQKTRYKCFPWEGRREIFR